jgi:hypothetical protein
MSDFNLSEKIANDFDLRKFSTRTGYSKFIDVEDVKEFIRLLKKEVLKFNAFDVWTISAIDKLAGEKLKC